MDSVRSGPFGQIFRPDNFIFGQVICCSPACTDLFGWAIAGCMTSSYRWQVVQGLVIA